MLGNPEAPLSMTMHSDFLCTACAFHVREIEPHVIDAYIQTGRIRLIHRHVTQASEHSQIAAEASECAAEQDLFWEMREQMYTHQQRLLSGDSHEVLRNFAAEIGMEPDTFNTCLDSRKHRDTVHADWQAAQAIGINSRPVFQIGEQRLIGNLPLSRFEQVLDDALESAQ